MLFKAGAFWVATIAALLSAVASASAAPAPRLLKDINPGAESQDINHGPEEFAKAGRRVFFSADDGSHGYELWKTDGTRGRTRLVRDIHPGPTGSEGYSFTNLDGALLFAADDGTHGYEVWRSDGTRRGTRLVRDIAPGADGSDPGEFFKFRGALYFGADDGTHGSELWRTDGTRRGTRLVRNIAPGAMSSFPDSFARLGNRLFFGADDGTHGSELWRSDGTRAGTKLLRNIAPGATSSDPLNLRRAGDQIFFYADDGTHGAEPWRSDGTRNGTKLVTDINPAPGGGSETTNFEFDGFARIGDAVFFSADDGTSGDDLWVIDGAQTRHIEINGAGDSFPTDFATVNGFVYFGAFDGPAGHGFELWRSDGTVARTKLVRDINPGGDSSPVLLEPVGRTLYFQARRSGGNDAELWRSDGTSAGTKLVKEFVPGADGGFPGPLVNIGGTLYFGARDLVHGAEPWTLPKPR